MLYGFAVLVAAFPSAIAGVNYTKALFKISLDQIKGERQKAYMQGLSTSRQYAQDMRLFNAGTYLKERYTRLWQKLYDVRRVMLKKRSIITGILECLPEIVIVWISLDISFGVLAGNSTIGDYTLYAGLSRQLLAGITSLTRSAIQIYDDKLRISNVKALENFKNRVQDTGTRKINRVQTIEFCGVSFSYPGSNRKVLDNISFNVAEREKVALVGMNGSGKSTLIKLLLRYYDVDKGAIRINGEDIRAYELFSLRSCFSVYFQDMLNYSFTLGENLTIADLDQVGQDSVLRAYQESCADDILKNAKMGLDTYLTRMFDEDGIELSGGQHQKIALARAFYRRHSALILDEPSSNLDPEAEHKVFEALGRLTSGKTTIFTSHRLSNVGLADRIVVIEDGKVIEQGTQAELLKNPKRFATLYKYQQDKFREAEESSSCGNR